MGLLGQARYVGGVAKNNVAQFVFWPSFQKGEYVCGLISFRCRPELGLAVIFRDVNVANASFFILNLRRPFFEKRVFFRKLTLFLKSVN